MIAILPKASTCVFVSVLLSSLFSFVNIELNCKVLVISYLDEDDI